MRIRSLTAPAVLVTGALLLTACGGDSPLEGKTGSEVAELAADALEESGAVHMAGTMTTDGEEGEVDLQLQDDDASGTITLGGVEIELISVDGDVYMKAAPEFWASFGMPEEAAAEFDGKWVAVPGDAAEGFSRLLPGRHRRRAALGGGRQGRDPQGRAGRRRRRHRRAGGRQPADRRRRRPGLPSADEGRRRLRGHGDLQRPRREEGHLRAQGRPRPRERHGRLTSRSAGPAGAPRVPAGPVAPHPRRPSSRAPRKAP
ncbi:hypothetical protein JKP75_18230 [Blastococcus sp. TML/M2B]|uniref:hypothetical protein n=1 Tax=Blastococcus sp. TML/M2B TaxID=2798727 RepID=UPI00190E53F7|nr:hypothetical protein [Blastococcus sp. TML/M2B]MBN1094318.1 hypothetical protein [Blastococcus sp. TML/M2B]